MITLKDEKNVKLIIGSIVFLDIIVDNVVIGSRPQGTTRYEKEKTKWTYIEPGRRLGPYIVLDASIERYARKLYTGYMSMNSPSERNAIEVTLDCVDVQNGYTTMWWTTPIFRNSVERILEQSVEIYVVKDGALEYIDYDDIAP
jgi:hypothetical protein